MSKFLSMNLELQKGGKENMSKKAKSALPFISMCSWSDGEKRKAGILCGHGKRGEGCLAAC